MAANSVYALVDWQQSADPPETGLSTASTLGGTAAWPSTELVYEPVRTAMVVDYDKVQAMESFCALSALNRAIVESITEV